MHEQIAGMHKIERCLGKRVADRIMPADLDGRIGLTTEIAGREPYDVHIS